MNGITFYIRLVNTGEYITETNDSLIWGKSLNINEAFSDTNYGRVLTVALFICEDKNLLPTYDVEIIEEEIIIKKTRLPLGDVDDFQLCDACDNWVHVDNVFTAKYNSERDICESCHDDGN